MREAPDVFWIQTNPFAIKVELDPEKIVDLSNEKWVEVMNPLRIPSVSYDDKVYGLMLWHNSPNTFSFTTKHFLKNWELMYQLLRCIKGSL